MPTSEGVGVSARPARTTAVMLYCVLINMVSTLRLEPLRNAAQPPGSRTRDANE